MKNEAPKMPLNARQVETAKPRDKAWKLADGGGLYLMVNTNGSKYWRMKYRFAGKEKKLSFGTYPDIPLAEARNKRDEAKEFPRDGSVRKVTYLAIKDASKKWSMSIQNWRLTMSRFIIEFGDRLSDHL